MRITYLLIIFYCIITFITETHTHKHRSYTTQSAQDRGYCVEDVLVCVRVYFPETRTCTNTLFTCVYPCPFVCIKKIPSNCCHSFNLISLKNLSRSDIFNIVYYVSRLIQRKCTRVSPDCTLHMCATSVCISLRAPFPSLVSTNLNLHQNPVLKDRLY